MKQFLFFTFQAMYTIFANIIDDKVDDKMFYSLIRNNIFSYDKWLEMTKSKSR